MAKSSRPRRTAGWWRERSRKAKAAIVVGGIFALFIAIGALAGSPAEDQPEQAAAPVGETTTEETTTEETTTASEPEPPPLPIVARVIDGDTIALENGKRVRLVQIDAPRRS